MSQEASRAAEESEQDDEELGLGGRFAVWLGTALVLGGLLVLMGVIFRGRPDAYAVVPVLVFEALIMGAMLLWVFAAAYTPLERIYDVWYLLMRDARAVLVILGWLFVATEIASTSISDWHQEAHLTYQGVLAVIVAVLVARHLIRGRIHWNSAYLLEQSGRKKCGKTRLAWCGAAYTLDLVLDMAVLMCFFAGATVVLASTGVVDHTPGRTPTSVAALQHYVWHFFDEIPALKITSTLGLKDPTVFVGVVGGTLVLLFKLIVIFPIIRYGRALQKMLRSDVPVLREAPKPQPLRERAHDIRDHARERAQAIRGHTRGRKPATRAKERRRSHDDEARPGSASAGIRHPRE